MNTTENNKLIAEFMSALWNIHSNKYGIGNAEFITIGEKTNVVKALNHYKLEELSYHSDWNWLMEVLEKVESLGYGISIASGKDKFACVISVEIGLSFVGNHLINKTKIEAVYNACVEFIKWYNNQNQ